MDSKFLFMLPWGTLEKCNRREKQKCEDSKVSTFGRKLTACIWMSFKIFSLTFFFFFFCCAACGILVSQSSLSPLQQKCSLNHWATREVPMLLFFLNSWWNRNYDSYVIIKKVRLEKSMIPGDMRQVLFLILHWKFFLCGLMTMTLGLKNTHAFEV